MVKSIYVILMICFPNNLAVCQCILMTVQAHFAAGDINVQCTSAFCQVFLGFSPGLLLLWLDDAVTEDNELEL